MHWREHLYILNRIESESFRYAFRHDLEDSLNGCLRFFGSHKIEICLTIGWTEIRYFPAIDAMRSLDDLTFRCLTKDLPKTDRGDSARVAIRGERAPVP